MKSLETLNLKHNLIENENVLVNIMKSMKQGNLYLIYNKFKQLVLKPMHI